MKATLAVLAGGVALTVLFTLIPAERTGAPWVPARADEVLERVAPGSKPVVAASADDAAVLARQLIEDSRARGGDPRLLGRAQAVLAPWWTAADAPAELVLMRATVKQALHDFPGALGDLDLVLRTRPGDAQAALTRATVLTVLGRPAEALASCELLPREGEPYAGCAAGPLALSGRLEDGLAVLALAPQSAWVRSLRGELLWWKGDVAAAEGELRAALQLDAGDAYTRLLLADLLLLDARRPGEVAALFPGEVRNDGELLRVVLAGAAPEVRADLEARVTANRQRGEVLHRREESRYALAIEHDASRALQLAVENWGVQREVADARVLLEAAVAAKQPAAAQPVVEWLEATKLPVPGLRALVKELRP